MAAWRATVVPKPSGLEIRRLEKLHRAFRGEISTEPTVVGTCNRRLRHPSLEATRAGEAGHGTPKVCSPAASTASVAQEFKKKDALPGDPQAAHLRWPNRLDSLPRIHEIHLNSSRSDLDSLYTSK